MDNKPESSPPEAKESDSFSDKVSKSYKWIRGIRHVDSFLSKASSVLDTVNELGEDPKVRNYIGVGTKIMRMGLSSPIIDPFKESKLDWLNLPTAYEEAVTKLISTHCPLKESFDPGGADNQKYFLYDLYGIPVLICKKWEEPRVFKGGDKDKFQDNLARLIQEKVSDGKWVQLEMTGNYNSCRCIFSGGIQGAIHPSERAEKVTEEVRKYLDKGINRSIIFHGPPGTGKTSLINSVALNIGTRVLSIEVGELARISPSDILLGINLAKPDVLIINDFDRLNRPSEFLNTLEKVHQNIKLFMVSANRLASIPDAVRRCGRFDQIISITKLDRGIIKLLLNADVPPEVFEEVSVWPAAFVAELGNRIAVLGIENIEYFLKELRPRVKQNNALYKYEEEEEKLLESDENKDEVNVPRTITIKGIRRK